MTKRRPSTIRKEPFPVANVRRYLEPGPIVLVTSSWKGKTNVMTLGWHMIMGEDPSLVGCFIWHRNLSHDMIRKSKECVVNVPTVAMAKTAVAIGNCSGRDVDKFDAFDLRTDPATKVGAPLLRDCHASFECRLYDAAPIRKYDLFVFEVVAAHVAPKPKTPRTLHYQGDGRFMIAGPSVATYRRHFRKEYL